MFVVALFLKAGWTIHSLIVAQKVSCLYFGYKSFIKCVLYKIPLFVHFFFLTESFYFYFTNCLFVCLCVCV